MCRGRGAVVFCPGGRLVFQRSWGGSESEEPAERNLTSVSCHRWLLSESARISLCWLYGLNLYKDTDATLDDLIESVAVLTKTCKDWRRVLGENHPYTSNIRGCLSRAQEKLADARAAASNKSKPPP